MKLIKIAKKVIKEFNPAYIGRGGMPDSLIDDLQSEIGEEIIDHGSNWQTQEAYVTIKAEREGIDGDTIAKICKFFDSTPLENINILWDKRKSGMVIVIPYGSPTSKLSLAVARR